MVSSISSVSSAASSLSTSSAQPVSQETQNKLKSLGLNSTGNEALDKANIKKAEEQKAQKSHKKEHSKTGEKPQSPYATIMSELGVTSTGKKEDDETAIENAISKLSSNAKTDAEKAKVASIEAEWSTIQAQETQKASQKSAAFETAQSQTAAVNKQLLVN